MGPSSRQGRQTALLFLFIPLRRNPLLIGPVARCGAPSAADGHLRHGFPIPPSITPAEPTQIEGTDV